jgi:RNA polymerase sigma-70 factor (ECF subfamily)
MTDWRDTMDRYGPIVWRTAYRILNDYTDASDCYQETFLAAVKLSRRQSVNNWPALLKTVAAARAIDRLKQRSRERSRSAGPDELAHVTATQAEPALEAEAADLLDSVRKALTQLPTQQAQVFWLRCVDSLSYQEIGDELGIKANRVGVLLHRARKRLQETLAENEVSQPRR